MRNYIFIGFFLLNGWAFGQFSQQYNQYMFNGLSINPAYAGVRECLSLTGVHSSQWVGFDGAPMSDNFTIHAPFRKRSGIGLNIFNDKIAHQNQTGIYGSYAYHLRTGEESKLSFGVSAGMSIFQIRDADVITIKPDNSFDQNNQSFSFPNIGAGLFFYKENFYAGLSAPTLFSSEYSIVRNNEIFSLRSNALVIFQTMGGVIRLHENIRWKPSYLIKYIPAVTQALDLNSNFYYKEKFNFGMSYRVKKSLVAMVGFTLKNKFDFGYSFAYPLSNLASYSSGTHEVMLRYELKETISTVNPRLY